MNRALILLGLAAFGLFLGSLTGCSPVSSQVSYYSLLDTQRPPSVAGTRQQLAILVGPVSVPDLLKTSQIATGTAERYQLAEQHRWVSQVDRDFARAIGEQLASRLGTERIALYPQDQYLAAPLQVVVDILAMEGALGQEARLTVRWSLVATKSKTARLTRRSTFSERPADSSHGAWVAAQRRNISRLSEEIAAAITSQH